MERAFKLDEMFTIKIPKVKTTNLLQKLHYNSIMFVHAVTGKFRGKFILISSEASQLSCKVGPESTDMSAVVLSLRRQTN